ncbi:MAG TPA: pseudouridine synthase [Ohtaekwangia sp.]|uniref:pseudouridine synthase n=1 Tax=Ohtaekwangia sp. TaxID=2066019 RepID=UPI002F956BDD
MPSHNKSNNRSGRSQGRSSNNAARPGGRTSKGGRDASAKGPGKPARRDTPGKSFSKKSGEEFAPRRSSAFSKPGKKYFTGKKEDSSETRGERAAKPFKRTGGKDFDKPFRSKRGNESGESPRKSFNSSGDRSFKRAGNKEQDKSFRSKRSDDSGESSRKSFDKPSERSFKRSDSKNFDKPFRSKRRDDSGESSRESSSDRPFKKRSSEEDSSRGFASRRRTTGGRRSQDAAQSYDDAPAQTEKIRLNRYIANSGVCSRREADELITMGLISVNGTTITELGYKVNPGDEVRYESKVLRAEKPVYVLLNKPKGYLTTTADPQERNTVMHLLGNHIKERIYPVGRLDRNTTGLLLLTNDGDLADKLMHPSYNVKKIYKVELDRPLTKADFQKISEGIQLEEGKAMVDDLAIISEDGRTVGVELHIGWNRVVRRIFESLEYQVVKLDRSVYAGLDKKDLSRGEWRFLKKDEILRLKHYK